MKKFLFWLLPVCLAFPVMGQQTFQKIVGDPAVDWAGFDGVTLSANNQLVATGFHEVQDWEISLAQIDLDGQLDWYRIFEYDSCLAQGFKVLRAEDAGYYVFGSTRGFCSKIVLLKTDADGHLEWTKQFGNDTLNCSFGDALIDLNGELMVIGTVHNPNTLDWDVILFRTTASGQAIWTFSLGGPGDESAVKIVPIENLGFLVGGLTNSFGAGGHDVFLSVINGVGDIFGFRTFGTPDNEILADIAVTPDRDFVATGTISVGGSVGSDIFHFQTDELGNFAWSQRLSSTGNLGARDMELLSNGHFLITGTSTPSGSTDIDGLLLETDSLGNPLWAHSYDHNSTDRMTQLKSLSNGEIVVVGSSASAPTLSAPLAVRTDANGNSGCQQQPLTVTPTLFNLSTGLDTATRFHPLQEYPLTLVETTWDPTADTTICDSCYTIPSPTSITYTVDGLTAHFTNPFPGATTVIWGPGTTSPDSTANPSYTYSGPGAYEVCVAGISACGNDTICETVIVGSFSVGEVGTIPVRVYPNPAVDQLTIDHPAVSSGQTQARLIDLQGREVANIQVAPAGTISLNRNRITPGVYLLELVSQNALIGRTKLILRD